MRYFPLFFSARPTRAVLEVLLVGLILWLGLFLLQNHLSSFLLRLEVNLVIGISCVLLFTLRLQLPEGSWRQQSIFEAVVGGGVSLLLSSIELVLTLVLLQGDTPNALWRGSGRPLLVTAIALASNYAMFIIMRIGIRLWLYWDQLRRKQLLWALTHAHVIVVILGAGLLFGVLEALVIYSSTDAFLVVSTTFGLIVLSGIALVAVVPPSALFSYLVIRRTTQRLKTLATATGALRAGDYTMRVPVVGEDEVAQLQSDFNAMAADLERTMQELQAERDRVADLLQARRELIATVSHELRTPVATLRSYLETTLSHWDERSQPILHHDLQVMEHEVVRLHSLIEDLFTLARAEVGRLTLHCEPTNLEVLVRRLVEARAPLVWQASRVEIVVDVSSELPAVLVDGNRLEQVLQNLLHNGVRHTSPGGIVAVVAAVEPEVVVLQIKDTGEGIAPEDLPHIWERFYRMENSRARTDNGTGLGLALVKEWIEAMGGTVAVESTPGEGSCFTLRLPRAHAGND